MKRADGTIVLVVNENKDATRKEKYIVVVVQYENILYYNIIQLYLLSKRGDK